MVTRPPVKALALAGCPAAIERAREEVTKLLASSGGCVCGGNVTYRTLPAGAAQDAISTWLAEQTALPAASAAVEANRMRGVLANRPGAQLILATAPPHGTAAAPRGSA